MYKRLLLAVTATLFVSFSLVAQEVETEDPKPTFKPSYSVKWNPGSLAFGKISIGGELNFKNRRSITAVIGLPKDKTLSYDFDDKEQSLTYKTTSLMAGYRMYLGKKTMTGFYFEPYLKYLNNEGVVPDIKTTIGGDPAVFRLNTDYRGFGVGAQLGLQFAIANRIVFDMFFLGPEANRSKFELKFTETTNPPTLPWDDVDENDARRELEELLSDIPIVGNKVNISVNRSARTVSSSYKGFIPGFRAGMSVGFRF